MEGKRRPGAAFWVAITFVVLLILYPMSTGPFVWLEEKIVFPMFSEDAGRAVLAAEDVIYMPLYWLLGNSPVAVQHAYQRYLLLWSDGFAVP